MFVQALLLWKSKEYYIFWVYMFVALVIQHAPYYIVDSGLHGSTMFFPHYLIHGTIFLKSYWIGNVCFDFLYNFYLKYFLF